jgi:heme-degrading monooxygenase HmoA
MRVRLNGMHRVFGLDAWNEEPRMIRIVYEWQVRPENIAAFREAWQQATTSIHQSIAGARGSFLLQARGDPCRILTVARWDSVEDWEAFWKMANPRQMLGMRALGKRVCVMVYDEFADLTV